MAADVAEARANAAAADKAKMTASDNLVAQTADS
jgi:hypothetical protein